MYIENSQAAINLSMSEHQVNEATAALKGMLGIGSSSTSSSDAAVDGSSPTTTTTSTTTKPVKEEVEQEPPKKTKRKKTSKKKKKKDANKEGASSSGKKQDKAPKQDKTAEKFAWSAFQASPDASTLPMPAFSPQASTKPTLSSETVSKLSTTTGIGSAGTEKEDAASQEKSNEKQPVAKSENSESDIVKETVTNTAERPPAKEEEQAEEAEAPPSNTGINLAALAASPSAQPSHVPTDSSFPGSPPSSYPPPPPPPPPPMYNSMSPPPPQQPQYVTIHVQVPPVLLPGRHMVVASPMGYPVQVRVPDGVPPGMIIPVHVPVAPPPQPPPPPPPPVYNRPYHHYGHSPP